SIRSIELARTVPLSRATARAIAGRARFLAIFEASYSEGAELAREALTFADESGDTRLAIHVLNTLGLARTHSGDAGGIDDLEEPVQRGEQAAAVVEWSVALNNLGNVLYDVGRLDDGDRRLAEARALCERFGITAGLAWNEGERVFQHDRRGDVGG